MTDLPPHRYLQEGLRLARPQATLQHALARADELRSRGSLPVLTLNHLARLTGASYDYLRSVVTRSREPYFDISLPKKTGGRRPISAPEPILLDVQRWMLDNLLNLVPIHGSSYAYQRGRSIRDCAERHIGSRWLMKFDLHDFFGSIAEPRVYRVYRSLGYSRLLSFEMTRLSTRMFGPRRPSTFDPPREHRIQAYTVGRAGVLPQGAPTSGLLANAVAQELDKALTHFASRHDLVYTRYSDDLTFSTSDRAFERTRASALIAEVDRIVRGQEFVLHAKKTRLVPPGARHLVLGLVVHDACVRLTPEFRHKVLMHVRGVTRFGLLEHAAARRFDSPFTLVEHVDGCIAFATGIEPDFAETVKQQWDEALIARGLPRITR